MWTITWSYGYWTARKTQTWQNIGWKRDRLSTNSLMIHPSRRLSTNDMEGLITWVRYRCCDWDWQQGQVALLFWLLRYIFANHGHGRVALGLLSGHSVWLTPIFRGMVSHSDCWLNAVGGVSACPWFVKGWYSLLKIPKPFVAGVRLLCRAFGKPNYLSKFVRCMVRWLDVLYGNEDTKEI